MRRRRGIKWSTLVVFCLLFVGLQILGVTYAQWTGTLQIGQTATTGALALQTSERDARACLVDSTGAEVAERPMVTGKLAEDGETLLLTVDGGFAAAALTGDGFLKLEVALQQGDESTVNRVEEALTDLSAQTDERVALTPSDPELVVGETTLLAGDLPPGTLDGFALPLTAEVYRRVETRPNGDPIATVYLRLTQESRDILNTPMAIETLTVDAADPLAGPLLTATEDGTQTAAQVRVSYTCSLSLYVEQGNENSLPLPGEE